MTTLDYILDDVDDDVVEIVDSVVEIQEKAPKTFSETVFDRVRSAKNGNNSCARISARISNEM